MHPPYPPLDPSLGTGDSIEGIGHGRFEWGNVWVTCESYGGSDAWAIQMGQWGTGDWNETMGHGRYKCGTAIRVWHGRYEWGNWGTDGSNRGNGGTNDCMNGCMHAPQHACTASMRCMHECSACMNELHAWMHVMWFMHDIYGVVLMHFIAVYRWWNYVNWCCKFCAFIYFLFDAACSIVHSSISFCQCHWVHDSAWRCTHEDIHKHAKMLSSIWKQLNEWSSAAWLQ